MIDNLEEKLNGTIPVTRKELFTLISSWGREDSFWTDDDIQIEICEPKECYDLSNLDVSKITDLSYIFRYSMYNGDLSKWDVSSCIDMNRMFSFSEFNNNSLKDWNVSKVKNINFLFYKSKFNGDLSKWNISKIKHLISTFDNCPFDGDISKWKFHKDVSCQDVFCDNKNFQNKYNYGKVIPYRTYEFLAWFEDNRLNIANSNLSKKDILDMDNYLESFNLEKEINRSK